MRVTSTIKHRSNELSGAALAASRQVWLAGLGAVVVGRDWVQAEAGQTFRSLVKEGTVVESRAVRYIGKELETSVTRANALWRQTRTALESTVRQAADSAVLFVKDNLPRSLPKIQLAAPAASKRMARPTKSAKPRSAAKRPVKRAVVKRRVAGSTKRAAASAA